MQVKSDYIEHAAKLATREIPMRVLKTAALIAYHQPIKQCDLVEMAGVKVYEHVKELAELGLIRIKPTGRTKLITTTARFPEYFGIASTSKQYIKSWLSKKVGFSEVNRMLSKPSESTDKNNVT
jgi:segregation and condensation protein B